MQTFLSEIVDFLSSVPLYFSFVYPILYIIRFNKNDNAYKYFTAYIVLIGLVQLTMKLYIFFQLGESNLFLFIYFMIFQLVTLSLFFHSLLKHQFILIILALVLVFFAIQYVLDPSLYFKYNPLGIVITQAILVTYSLIYFYKSLSSKGPFVIVNYGLFVYLLSSMLIFASGNLIFNKFVSTEVLKKLQDLNLLLYFVFQVFIVVEWWINYRPGISKNN